MKFVREILDKVTVLENSKNFRNSKFLNYQFLSIKENSCYERTFFL
ncbi:MAG: hypothetical protein SPH54_00370 [Fusobacterium gastrosuis]|nr:hypothetical protein [Fusobacterium gastrosuis]